MKTHLIASLCALALLGADVSAQITPNDPINRETNVYELSPGFSAIANPLIHRRGTSLGDSQIDNRIATLFPRVPNGTVLYKFDAEAQRYSLNRFGRRGWTRPNETLDPGDGALFLNPTRRTLRLVVTGEPGDGGLRVAVRAGFSLISFPGIAWVLEPLPPGVPPPFEYDSRYFHPAEGDVVFTLDHDTQAWVPHTYRNGEWDTVPVVNDTESFFVFTRVPRVIENKDPIPN